MRISVTYVVLDDRGASLGEHTSSKTAFMSRDHHKDFHGMSCKVFRRTHTIEDEEVKE